MVTIFGLVIALRHRSPASWAFAGSGATRAGASPKCRRAAGVAGAAGRVPSQLSGWRRGDGCTYPTSGPSAGRRRFHHLTFYGFLLCFAVDLRRRRSTTICSAGRRPTPCQPAGRARHARRHRPDRRAGRPALAQAAGRPGAVRLPAARHGRGVSRAAVPASLTGVLLLLLRATPAMGMLLAVHLGVMLGAVPHPALRQVRARRLPRRSAGALRDGAPAPAAARAPRRLSSLRSDAAVFPARRLGGCPRCATPALGRARDQLSSSTSSPRCTCLPPARRHRRRPCRRGRD